MCSISPLAAEFSLLALPAELCHAACMEKNKRLAEEAEDRERMARILKRHQKPAKKETRPDDEAAATIVNETPEHN